jgi:hypothetical protein
MGLVRDSGQPVPPPVASPGGGPLAGMGDLARRIAARRAMASPDPDRDRPEEDAEDEDDAEDFVGG